MNKALAAKFLGIAETATLAEAKAAYKKKASVYHPDKPTGDAEKFKEIQAAYEYFQDPSKFRNSSTYSDKTESPKKDYKNPWENDFRRQFNDYMNAKGFSDDFFSQGNKKSHEDQEYNITITLEQAFNGGTTHCRIRTVEGKVEDVYITIPKGIRMNEVMHSFIRGEYKYVFRAAIDPVDSIGTKYNVEYFSTYSDDTKIQGIKDGDLNIDFYCPIVTMIIGGFVDIRTIDGSTVRVRIPEGQEANMKLKLRGKGFWKGPVKFGERGDIYLKIIPDVKGISKIPDDALKALIDAAQFEVIARKMKNKSA